MITKNSGKQWGNADLRETKQLIYHSKGIDESYPKMYLLFNLSHYVKSCGHFCQILAFFYDARSPDMVMSRDPRSKFQKFLFCPNSAFNIRKVTKFLVEKFSTSEVISQKTPQGVENTPSPPPVL